MAGPEPAALPLGDAPILFHLNIYYPKKIKLHIILKNFKLCNIEFQDTIQLKETISKIFQSLYQKQQTILFVNSQY